MYQKFSFNNDKSDSLLVNPTNFEIEANHIKVEEISVNLSESTKNLGFHQSIFLPFSCVVQLLAQIDL